MGKSNNKKITQLLETDNHVLMTFQVDEGLRSAANEKAKETSINLSQFLRQCVHEFTYSNDIGQELKKLQKNVTRKALE